MANPISAIWEVDISPSRRRPFGCVGSQSAVQKNALCPRRASLTPSFSAATNASVGCRYKRIVIGPCRRPNTSVQNRSWVSHDQPYQATPSTSSTAVIARTAHVMATDSLDGALSFMGEFLRACDRRPDPSSRKKERDEESQLLPGRTIRALDVAVVLRAQADRTTVEDGGLADAEAERHRPLVALGRVPVGRHDRGECQRPAVAEVVVD